MSRRGISIGIGAVIAAVVLVLVLSGGSHRTGGAVATASAGRAHTGGLARASPAAITVSSLRPLAAVPDSFLGFSTEYWTLPIDERYLSLYARALSLIHVIGDGPLVLRIGGDSSDHTFFDPRLRKLPRWAFE